MLTISFTMLGDVVLARGFSRFGDAVKDFRPVWRELMTDFYRIEREQFETRGARGGVPWPPLSPRYAAWKSKFYPGKGVLELTGAMRSAMTLGVGLKQEVLPFRLRLTPSMPYAGIHQQGAPYSNIPMRKVVQLTAADKERWVKAIHEYIFEQSRRRA